MKPADLFLRDTCAQCGEPNAHYVDDGCTGQQDHVITDERERRRLLLHHAIARLTRVLAGGTYARPT